MVSVKNHTVAGDMSLKFDRIMIFMVWVWLFKDGCGMSQKLCLPHSGTWHSPLVSETRPPPCAWFSLTMIVHHLAVLFGGYQASSNSYCNDVYILDLRRMVSCLWVLLEHNQPELVRWLA